MLKFSVSRRSTGNTLRGALGQIIVIAYSIVLRATVTYCAISGFTSRTQTRKEKKMAAAKDPVFFKVLKARTTECEKTKLLSDKRRHEWLARISRPGTVDPDKYRGNLGQVALLCIGHNAPSLRKIRLGGRTLQRFVCGLFASSFGACGREYDAEVALCVRMRHVAGKERPGQWRRWRSDRRRAELGMRTS
ncbi:hypothetical protein MRX96_033471 [Rhipicephalus microplus]